MNRSATLGIGASLLSFGVMWFFLSVLIINVAYGGQGNGVAFLALELVASALTTIGIGLLVYGASMNSSRLT